MRSALFYFNASVIVSVFSLNLNTPTSASLQEQFKSDIIKSIQAPVKTSVTQTVCYAPSHPVTGFVLATSEREDVPGIQLEKISVTSLIGIDFSHRLGTCSRHNFPTCSTLLYLVAQVEVMLFSQWTVI